MGGRKYTFKTIPQGDTRVINLTFNLRKVRYSLHKQIQFEYK